MSEIDHRPAAGTAAQVSQATTVEQSRAIAMVQSAFVVAQQRPRNIEAARREMLESCQILGMAERAFFSYSRGGPKPVTGPTVHLARELAVIWGNIQHGIAELDRNDVLGFSEMTAFAIDLQKNTRVDNTFRVVHQRDISKTDRAKGKTPERLVDLRDIYENNSNMAARRERTAVFGVLPKWFTDEAEDTCRATLKSGGKGALPLAQRLSNMIDRYATDYSVTTRQLTEHLGKPPEQWDGRDVAALGILYRSLEQQTITMAEAFPSTVRLDDIPAPGSVVLPPTRAAGQPAAFDAPPVRPAEAAPGELTEAEQAEAYEREQEARQAGG